MGRRYLKCLKALEVAPLIKIDKEEARAPAEALRLFRSKFGIGFAGNEEHTYFWRMDPGIAAKIDKMEDVRGIVVGEDDLGYWWERR